MKTNVLVLCTGNACRSQMAEGWLRALRSDVCDVQSAGIEAHGVNATAVEIMAEVGIDISQHQSTVIDGAMIEWATLVITVCGHADEACPTLPQIVKRIHWPTPDPAALTGTPEEVKAGFRAVRDSLKARITDLLI